MEKIRFRPDKPEKHELFIRGNKEGELVYESDMLSTLERRESEMVFTIQVAKTTNWITIAKVLVDECCDLSAWAFMEQRKHHFEFEQLDVIFDDIEMELDSGVDVCIDDLEDDEDCEYDGSEEVFMLTYFEHWWEMYEGDDSYLLRYRLPKCETYPLMCRNDLDALEFLIRDEMDQLTSFLRGWYERVTGYRNAEGK